MPQAGGHYHTVAVNTLARHSDKWSFSLQAGDADSGDSIKSVSIGVTGHRSERLNLADLDLLRDRVRHVFRAIVDTTGAHLTVVSSLADGTDQIVAEEAVAAGYRLVCPLPYSVADFDHEFANRADLVTFHRLILRADLVMELGGSRETAKTREAAYVAAGAEMLSLSDVLLAIWDGQDARGSGGTAEVIAGASENGTPVVWIAADTPHTIRIIDDNANPETAISRAILNCPEQLMGHNP